MMTDLASQGITSSYSPEMMSKLYTEVLTAPAGMFMQLDRDFEAIYGQSFSGMLDALIKDFDYEFDQAFASERGKTLFDRFWGTALGTSGDQQAAMKAEVNKYVDMMFDALGESVTGDQKVYTKNLLFDMLAGDDGIMTGSELSKLGEVIGNVFHQIMDQGFANTEFGDIGAAMMQSLFGNWDDFGKDEQKQISDGIGQLLEKGVSEANIRDYLKDADPLDDMMSGYIDYIKEKLSGADFADAIEAEDIGLASTLDTLLASGYSVKELNEIFGESDSWDEFAARLQNLGEAAKSASESADGVKDLIDTLAEFSKATESASGNVDKLTKIRDAILGGKDISVGDLNEILELYPKLFSMMGDNDTFLKGIDQGIEEQKQKMEDSLREFLQNSTEIYENSPWADLLEGEGHTLADLIGTLPEDSDQYAEILAFIEEIIAKYRELLELEGEGGEEEGEAKTLLQKLG